MWQILADALVVLALLLVVSAALRRRAAIVRDLALAVAISGPGSPPVDD